jgi:mRNA-degrading endonuclease RelE of RelBE toxin-antitoxin system
MPSKNWKNFLQTFNRNSASDFWIWKSIPDLLAAKKLTNRPGYRIRYGDYRIIYTIEDHILTVTVIDTGHRKEIYE